VDDVSERLWRVEIAVRRLDQLVSNLYRHLDLPLPAEPGPDGDLDPLVLAALRAGNKIKAIQLYQAATRASLRDSKAAIEELERQLRG
jgi:hypothetical protein